MPTDFDPFRGFPRGGRTATTGRATPDNPTDPAAAKVTKKAPAKKSTATAKKSTAKKSTAKSPRKAVAKKSTVKGRASESTVARNTTAV